jgi:hypothetical protein
MILVISASQVARITGLSYQHPAGSEFLKLPSIQNSSHYCQIFSLSSFKSVSNAVPLKRILWGGNVAQW